jgi:non-specific serine/threonine protein kinase
LFVRLEALDRHGCDGSDEEINDEHLIQLVEVLGPLPRGMASRWRRRSRYYRSDGERLGGCKGGGGSESGNGDVDDHGEEVDEDEEDAEMAGLEPRTRGGGSRDSPTSMSSQSSCSSWLASPGTFDSLEERLRDQKPEDMSESEEKEVAQMLRWIFEYDPSKRPSAEAILQHPWFSF